MTNQEQFFYDHAGYSWNEATGETEEQGKLRCARELAKAEQWLNENEWDYSIVPDEDIDLSWMDEVDRLEPHEVVGVVLNKPEGTDGENTRRVMKYSLWGITDPDENYIRVVVAELALEAMADEEKEQEESKKIDAMMLS